jgi:hypothetical protein
VNDKELAKKVFTHFGFQCDPEHYLLPGGKDSTTRLVDIISYVHHLVALSNHAAHLSKPGPHPHLSSLPVEQSQPKQG